MSNDSDKAYFRAPRVWVQINGALVNSVLHVDMTNSGSCKSSRFELTVSTNVDKISNQWLDLIDGKVTVQIFMRSEWLGNDIMAFEGLADNIAIDSINRTARILGRDYSSVLINSMHQSAFCNQTASEIANCIAARHGFSSNILRTETMIGSYQCGGYNQVLLNAHSRIVNEWELLVHLAISEGFELFIDGTTLVFAPSNSLPSINAVIDVSNVIGMKFYKNCPSSNQTTLTVKSWNSWLNETLLHTDDQSSDQAVPSIGRNNDPGSAIAIVRPNLNPQSAERLAKRHIDALNEQELNVHIVMAGDMSLSPRDVLTVSGSGSSFDDIYIVRSVRRYFSSTSGFTQHIQAFTTKGNFAPPFGNQASFNG